MMPESTVNCATDHEEYFAWIQRAFERSARFTEADPAVLPLEAQTDFEKEICGGGKTGASVPVVEAVTD